MNQLDNYRNKHVRKSGLAATTTTANMVPVGSDNVSPSQSGTESGQQKRLWVKDRSKDWCDKCNNPYFLDEEFKRVFRVSKATFNMVCEELEPTVMKKNMALHNAIPVHQRATYGWNDDGLHEWVLLFLMDDVV
ncbi:hypothetical protein V6N13_082322 [Hibiscus sabdariffa]